jgi:hypothetical protein
MHSRLYFLRISTTRAQRQRHREAPSSIGMVYKWFHGENCFGRKQTGTSRLNRFIFPFRAVESNRDLISEVWTTLCFHQLPTFVDPLFRTVYFASIEIASLPRVLFFFFLVSRIKVPQRLEFSTDRSDSHDRKQHGWGNQQQGWESGSG